MGTLTKVAWWMVAAGTIAGPGYSIYCDFFSGSPVGKFKMSERVGSWAAPDGQTMTFGPAGAFKPFVVELDPEMNPVGFVWRAYVEGGSTGVRYSARLYLGDEMVLNRGVGMSNTEDHGTHSSMSAGTVRVSSAGRYHFVLEPVPGNNTSGVSDMEIEVRRNVMVKKMWIVGPGIAVMVVSFLLVFWLKNRERKALYEIPEHVRGSQAHTLLTPDFGVRLGICPYCRKPLKSERAKQCLLCGADWHKSST